MEACRNLQDAVYRRNSKCLRSLISEGANVNQRIGGQTVLRTAVERCSIEDIRFLISAGADVNATLTFGLTVLMIAAREGRDDVIQILIEAGADTNASDSDGVTALLHATKNGWDSSVRALAEAGADLNIPSILGETPLNMMVKFSRYDCVKYLIEKGADVNFDSNGTALHYGVLVSNEHSTRLLLGAGADVNIPDETGITPWMFASGRRFLELLAHGTNDTTTTLMSICRRAIRKYLLNLDRRQTNLYVQVTKLGLPSSVVDYLLYKDDD